VIVRGVTHVPRPAKSGWTVDMTVVDDLVYSPVSGLPLAAARVLVAPNHYHHLALPKLRAQFPDAMVVASDGAQPRLVKQGHAGIRPLHEAKLPEGVRLLPAEGVKNGETWMSIERDGERVLVVADAFFNVEQPCTGFEGFMLRRLRTVGGLRLGRTFQWLAVGDKAAYRKWASDTLARLQPTVIAFAHGAPLRDANAWKTCVDLVERHVR
jgi:hypothetical protein